MLSPINLQLKNKDLLDLERLVISRLPKTRSGSKSDIHTFRPNTGLIPLHKSTPKITKVPPIPNLDRFLLQASPIQGSLELTSAQNLTDRVPQAAPIQNRQAIAYSSTHFEHAKLEPKTSVTYSPQTTKAVKTIERIDKQGSISSPRLEQIKLRKFDSTSKSNIYLLKIGSYIDTDQHIAPVSAKDNGMTGFFQENRKKYPTKAQFFSLAQKAKDSHHYDYEDNIGLIKIQAKQSVFKRAKISLPNRIDMKQKSREMTVWPTNKLEMSKEDETKLSVLKKKMETFTKFNAMSNMDDRKKLYRELTLEFHPDKSKHEKALSEEIFAFLRNNKKTFLVC